MKFIIAVLLALILIKVSDISETMKEANLNDDQRETLALQRAEAQKLKKQKDIEYENKLARVRGMELNEVITSNEIFLPEWLYAKTTEDGNGERLLAYVIGLWGFGFCFSLMKQTES